jgi:hypothetical protein
MGLPSTFHSTPSLTVAIAPHFQKQMSQKVGTVRSPFSAGRPAARSPERDMRAEPPAAATPAPAPAILRKRRLERAIFPLQPGDDTGG